MVALYQKQYADQCPSGGDHSDSEGILKVRPASRGLTNYLNINSDFSGGIINVRKILVLLLIIR